MNIVNQIQVDYLRASRTLETILLMDEKNHDKQKVVYIYNFEGYHFRIFENIFEVSNFLNNNNFKVLKEYSTNNGVENFLRNLIFKY